MEGVKYVERDQAVKALQTECELQEGAPWGLVRTTLREWDTNPNDPPNEYEHSKNGECCLLIPINRAELKFCYYHLSIMHFQ